MRNSIHSNAAEYTDKNNPTGLERDPKILLIETIISSIKACLSIKKKAALKKT
jgi:hypothetical protein